MLKTPVMSFSFFVSTKFLQAKKFLGLNKVLIGCFFIITLLNLQFRRGIPTYAATNTPHDDLLGVQLASNFMRGEWLGDWYNLTLGKPPGYSLYLAVAKQIPTQLVVVNQLIFCLISILLVIVLRNSLLRSKKRSNMYAIVAYSVIIFNPYLFSVEMSRPYRTSLHTILVLLFCALSLGFWNEIKMYHLSSKEMTSFRKKLRIWVVALSVNYFALIMLRPESYWILIPFVSVVFGIVVNKTTKSQSRNKIQYIKTVTSFLFIGVLLYFSFISLLGQVNKNKYGTSLIENYYSAGFANAIKDWQRVEDGKDSRPYVIVSKDQRLAVYKISPNAAKLKPWLEIEPGQGWQIHPCNSPIKLCDNAGGWFTWQVRDAAISTGEVRNEREFQDFFQQISTDIKEACESNQIQCGSNSLGVGVKSLGDLPLKKVVEYSAENVLSAASLAFNTGGEVATPDQYGADSMTVDLFHSVVNYRAQPAGSKSVTNYSGGLKILQKIYAPVQFMFIFLTLVGLLLAWRKENRFLVYSVFIFSLMGILLVSLGVSLAQVSYGWRTEGPYLLPMQPLLQFLLLAGATSLIADKRETKNLINRNK